DGLLPALGRVLVHAHLAGLLLVELVRRARGGEELRHAVTVDVADLDLVHERVRRSIDLLDPPSVVRMYDCDHALVVGRDHELVLAVAVEVAALDVAQAIDLPSDRRTPVCVGGPGPILESPGAQQSAVAADGEDTTIPAEGLVEDVAVGILENRRRPARRGPP